MEKKPFTAIIADDQELFAESLSYVVNQVAPDLQIVGIANSGTEVVEMVTKRQPDLVLMDVRMPLMDGVVATKIIHSAFPEVKIIILTTFDDDEYVLNAVRNGAKGYLLKNMNPYELIDSVRAVMRGATLFSEKIAEKLAGIEEQTEPFARTIQSLSRRERQVLALVMETLSNHQISDRLNLSQQSVRNYVSSIYAAFGINDRMELIQRLRGVMDGSEIG